MKAYFKRTWLIWTMFLLLLAILILFGFYSQHVNSESASLHLIPFVNHISGLKGGY